MVCVGGKQNGARAVVIMVAATRYVWKKGEERWIVRRGTEMAVIKCAEKEGGNCGFVVWCNDQGSKGGFGPQGGAEARGGGPAAKSESLCDLKKGKRRRHCFGRGGGGGRLEVAQEMAF